jgi:sec-independent protein translocase protein TatB
MLDLSPVKLLFILIVAMILLGPDKLPQVARQMGSAWRRLRELQQRIDSEVRQSIPDLPSTQDIARFARSPVALLNQLADFDSRDELVRDPGAGASPGGGPDEDWPVDPAAVPPPPAFPPDPGGVSAPGTAPAAGDPGMN